MLRKQAPGSRGREEPRRRPDNSNSRGQARGAADDGPRPSPSASAHGSSQPSRASATSGAAGAGSRGGRDSSTQSGAGASASGGAAGGDDGARHRKPAASGGETGFDPHQKADLNARLGDLSVSLSLFSSLFPFPPSSAPSTSLLHVLAQAGAAELGESESVRGLCS